MMKDYSYDLILVPKFTTPKNTLIPLLVEELKDFFTFSKINFTYQVFMVSNYSEAQPTTILQKS